MTGYCLEELAFWDKLSDQERERVRAAAYEADYEPGQMIWSGERDCLGLLLIRSGVVRLFLLSEDGREATISRISGGQVCIMTASCTMSVSSFKSGPGRGQGGGGGHSCGVSVDAGAG